ncbi:MAG TPA: MarR family transcriptional regulator [Gaiellaceae bacterium]|jgi:DNA-binding MarR family transcriptional regulator|nr:MarR family transcriptional regulator [Gaiellaceae bacterium]
MIEDIERATHLVAVHLERAAGDLGVTQAEAHVLAQLARRGTLTVAVLHHEFGHKRSTLTSVLDRLESRGLVQRTVHPADRRSFLVEPTPAGKRAGEAVVRVVDELEARIRSHVTERDVAGVRAVADALRETVT